MLNYLKTRLTQVMAGNVMPGVEILEDGYALAFVAENGQNFVRPATGASGEKFAGFSHERNTPPSMVGKNIEFAIAAEFDLDRIPVDGQLLVKIDGAAADITVGTDAPVAAGDVTLNGSKLMFHADDVNKLGWAQFMYSPSMMEARSYQGDFPANGLISKDPGVIGRLVAGEVYTSIFDASVDWRDHVGKSPRLGAEGRLTIGGSGTELTNWIVASAPAGSEGFLGLEHIPQ